jgi:iron complex transport system substrate-binding protein
VLEPTDLRARFFTDLGFVNAAETGEIGQERFALLDQDVLVIMGVEKDAMLANPVFAQLPVVREGRTFYAGGFGSEFSGALGYGSPLSLPYALDIAVPALAAATDGDPASVAG